MVSKRTNGLWTRLLCLLLAIGIATLPIPLTESRARAEVPDPVDPDLPPDNNGDELQNDLDKVKHCQLVKMDSNGHIVNPLTTSDFNDTQVQAMMRLYDDMDKKTVIWRAQSTHRGTIRGTYQRVPDTRFFLKDYTVENLEKLGIAVQPPVHIWMGSTEGMRKFPEAPRYRMIVTTCGTLVLRKYSCTRGGTVQSFAKVTWQDTDPNKAYSWQPDPKKMYIAKERWELVSATKYKQSPYSFANGQIIEKDLKYWNGVVLGGELLLTAMELVPFIGAVRASLEGLYGYREPYGAGTAILFEASIDAIPFVAQAKKLRKFSKVLYVVAAGAAVAQSIKNYATTGKLTLEDYVRMIILGILSPTLFKKADGFTIVAKVEAEVGETLSSIKAEAITNVGTFGKRAASNAGEEILDHTKTFQATSDAIKQVIDKSKYQKLQSILNKTFWPAKKVSDDLLPILHHGRERLHRLLNRAVENTVDGALAISDSRAIKGLRDIIFKLGDATAAASKAKVFEATEKILVKHKQFMGNFVERINKVFTNNALDETLAELNLATDLATDKGVINGVQKIDGLMDEGYGKNCEFLVETASEAFFAESKRLNGGFSFGSIFGNMVGEGKAVDQIVNSAANVATTKPYKGGIIRIDGRGAAWNDEVTVAKLLADFNGNSTSFVSKVGIDQIKYIEIIFPRNPTTGAIQRAIFSRQTVFTSPIAGQPTWLLDGTIDFDDINTDFGQSTEDGIYDNHSDPKNVPYIPATEGEL